MNNFRTKTLIPAMASALAFSAVPLYAGEHTLKADKFEQVIQVQATALPTEGAGFPISIKPEVWGGFKVEKFLSHGASVKKGEKLLWVDTEALDEKIEELAKERVKQKLVLEKAELELKSSRASTAESLAKAKLEYERFVQDYDYYKEVVKPQNASDKEYEVKRVKNHLTYAQEELDQLLKMYEEDGLTEETEEIIIRRAKHGLTASQKKLKKTELGADYNRKIVAPRTDADWEVSAVIRKRNWELVQKKLPLDLKIKELGVAKLKRNDEKSEKQLNDLKVDRALMEFKSPADGVVYFGEFKDGKWISEAATKVVRVGGDIPVRMVFMTVVPRDTKLSFNAFLTEKQKLSFNPDLTGSLRLNSNPWKSVEVGSELVSQYPVLSRKWLVSFTPKEEKLSGVMIGSKANVSIVTASADDVLSVPVNAVKSHADGSYSVRVKMAEGDPKITKVELGRQAGDKVEILGGVENGQVILTP